MTEEENQIQIINNFIMYCRGFEEKKYTDKELFTAIEYVSDLIQKQRAEKEQLKVELEKKDKIIEEMAIFIANSDIDEEICKHQVATFCDDKPEGVTLDVCTKCIKQYFEKKVEGQNEHR